MTSRGKVIHYPLLQQRLIDTRHKLDREVEQLHRMHAFYRRALLVSSRSGLTSYIAESLVDVFEFEFGVCWRLDGEGEPTGVPGVFGCTPPPMSLVYAARYLMERFGSSTAMESLGGDELASLNALLPVVEADLAICRDLRDAPIALILGGTSPEGEEIYGRQGRGVAEPFTLFASQVGSLFDKRRSRAIIDNLNRDLLAVLGAIPDPMFEIDEQGRFINVWANHQHSSLVPRGMELTGRTIDRTLPPAVVSVLRDAFAEADESETSVGRQLLIPVASGDRWFELSISKKQSSTILKHYIVLARDVTERMDSERELRETRSRAARDASLDALTGLPNRLAALEVLEQRVTEPRYQQRQMAVVVLDLDDFNKVNDNRGHSSGDAILREAARRLQSVVRDNDTVARLGADEFILLLDGVRGIESATQTVEVILETFREPFPVHGRDLLVTLSAGLAMFPGDDEHSAELLRKADSAMHHAKLSGKNTLTVYKDTLNRGAERRLAIEEHLHGALERDELQVYYQPKVNLQTGLIGGAEALLRWQSPVLGSVSPEEFIPIAERTDQIVKLGDFVLDRALADGASWAAGRGGAFTMAINISPRQFRDMSLETKIHRALQCHGFAPTSLELEITEGLLMEENEHLDRTLAQLKALGIRLAMDDFGTGYSSLSYLRTYPFDAIKIDRSFVSDMERSPKDLELVNAAIAMGHGLGMTVIAEGVERAEQARYLRTQRCDFGQGYFWSAPVSAGEFSVLLEQGYQSAFTGGVPAKPVWGLS